LSGPDSREVTEWLERLVAYHTVAGSENHKLVDDVGHFLTAIGFHCSEIPTPKGDGANLCASIGPTRRPGVVLSAHTDVVPAHPGRWRSDPFALTQRGSRLYGRGTADMKGFIAAVLAAAPSVAARELRGSFTIALSTDEELGVKGVQPMLDVLAAELHPPTFCVVGEPTGMRVAVAHKSKITLRIAVQGRAAHASAAPSGVSAIAHAATMVQKLYEYQRRLVTEGSDRRFPTPYATVNVGQITGGTAVNVVADRCAFDVELRGLPSSDLAILSGPVFELAKDTQAEMRRRAPEASVNVSVDAQYPGLDSGGAMAELVAQFADSDFGIAVDFGTEAGLYSQRLGVPVLICGPGNIAQAHADDEFVEEAELLRATCFVERIANWLCSG
jgi:acetylornithine deacetylase